MRNDERLALLTAENPVSEAELAGPRDAQARALLDRLLLDDGRQRTPSAPPTRRRLRVAVAAAAVVAVALGALSLLPGDEPERASAIERAAAALGHADGDILHVVTHSTLTGPGGEVLRRERTEAWQATSEPYDMRQVITSDAGTARELAVRDGHPEVYDGRSDTISALPPALALPAGPAQPPLPNTGAPIPDDHLDTAPERLRTEILDLLRSGEAREDGHITVDGHEAVRIVAPALDMRLLVDAETYQPIEWTVPVTGIGTHPDRGLLTTTFATYERLPASDANLALLDLRAQHPGATADQRISIERFRRGSRARTG
jgi:hypothetical protein